jgi:hypothetical protein
MQLMKKLIITFLSIGLLSVLFPSCLKKSEISGDMSALVLGSYVTLDSTINSNLDFSNASSAVSIKIKGKVGSPVASINIYVATGSDPLDTSGWKLIKNVAYSDGVILSVSTTELTNALAPNPIAPGTQYVLQNQVVTKDGRKFSVANTPSTYNSFPAYNMALTWFATAVCVFNQTDAAGTYKVTYDDDWKDYHDGDLITVSPGPGPNEINALIYPSIVLGGGTGQVNTIIDVDPATDVATVKSQFTGYYGPSDPANKVTVSGSGVVFSCTGYISILFNVNIGGSNYGGIHFRMQHQ